MPDPGTFIAASTTRDDVDYGWTSNTYYHTVISFGSVYTWDKIGMDTVSPTEPFKTQRCKGWGVNGSVTGEGSIGLPFVASGKISVTIGGNWSIATTHELNSGPGGGPLNYVWRYGHYQKSTSIGVTVNVMSSTAGPWSTHAATFGPDAASHNYTMPVSGTNDFLQTTEKQDP